MQVVGVSSGLGLHHSGKNMNPNVVVLIMILCFFSDSSYT